MLLGIAMCVGLVLSYTPQIYRIIVHKSGIGLSPTFLLLGSISSASCMLNILVLQWGQIECCKYVALGMCLQSLLGSLQLVLSWACFSSIFVLYLVNFPRDLKYVQSVNISHEDAQNLSFIERQKRYGALWDFFSSSTPLSGPGSIDASNRAETSVARDGDSDSSGSSFDARTYLLPGLLRKATVIFSAEYRQAIACFGLAFVHLVICTLVTVILLDALPTRLPPEEDTEPGKEHPSEHALNMWAACLGVIGAATGAAQYLPQLFFTLTTRLVGSLSIPMMYIQAPGSFIFTYSIAIRDGVNWTSYVTFLITGILQGSLLFMCLAWKRRQRILGIDDWGLPLESRDDSESEISALLEAA